MDGLIVSSGNEPYYTSTTSFQAIDPNNPSSALYIGGTLDRFASSIIPNASDASTNILYFHNGGPTYGIIYMKANSSYYSGIIWGYHSSCKMTPWLFTYENGTYTLRPLANPRSK